MKSILFVPRTTDSLLIRVIFLFCNHEVTDNRYDSKKTEVPSVSINSVDMHHKEAPLVEVIIEIPRGGLLKRGSTGELDFTYTPVETRTDSSVFYDLRQGQKSA